MIDIAFWGLVVLFIVLYLMYQHERIECNKWKRECVSLHAENRALRFKVSGRLICDNTSFFKHKKGE